VKSNVTAPTAPADNAIALAANATLCVLFNMFPPSGLLWIFTKKRLSRPVVSAKQNMQHFPQVFARFSP
jgi:hypothetical protein